MRSKTRKLSVKTVLYDVAEVKAFLHRVVLTSNFKYEDLCTVYEGSMYFIRRDSSDSKSTTYDKRYILTLSSGVRCSLDMYPDKGYKPLTVLSVSSPTVYTIREIYDDATKILLNIDKERSRDIKWKISSIEYTFDFICNNSTMVGDLYYVLKRYAYFPYCGMTRMFGGRFFGYSEAGDYSEEREGVNSVTQYLYTKNEKSRFQKLAKIYERGKDSDNRGRPDWWSPDKCDRVRCEITARRPVLKSKGVNSLVDLLNDTHFERLFFPPSDSKVGALLQFKQFAVRKYRVTEWQKQHYKGTSNRRYIPPLDSENFRAIEGKEGDDKYTESFQEELFKAASEGYRNITIQSSHFDSIRRLMEEAVHAFDTEWMQALSGE